MTRRADDSPYPLSGWGEAGILSIWYHSHWLLRIGRLRLLHPPGLLNSTSIFPSLHNHIPLVPPYSSRSTVFLSHHHGNPPPYSSHSTSLFLSLHLQIPLNPHPYSYGGMTIRHQGAMPHLWRNCVVGAVWADAGGHQAVRLKIFFDMRRLWSDVVGGYKEVLGGLSSYVHLYLSKLFWQQMEPNLAYGWASFPLHPPVSLI